MSAYTTSAYRYAHNLIAVSLSIKCILHTFSLRITFAWHKTKWKLQLCSELGRATCTLGWQMYSQIHAWPCQYSRDRVLCDKKAELGTPVEMLSIYSASLRFSHRIGLKNAPNYLSYLWSLLWRSSSNGPFSRNSTVSWIETCKEVIFFLSWKGFWTIAILMHRVYTVRCNCPKHPSNIPPWVCLVPVPLSSTDRLKDMWTSRKTHTFTRGSEAPLPHHCV